MRLLLAILLLLVAAPAWAQQGQGMSQAMVISSCGGGAATSGALTQLTMDTTGRLCQSGIGSNVCSQATAYLARTTGGNEGGNAVAITALICGLVSDGVITGTLAGTTTCGTHLDALYILAQQNVADAKLNLCGTSYTLPTNTATFTSYKGYSAFPANGIDTGFNASTSPNFAQNSASVGAWVYDTPNAGMQIASDLTIFGTNLIVRYSDVNNYCGVNSANGGGSVPYSGIGLFVCDRQNSLGINFYYNGSSIGVAPQGSNTVSSNDMAIGDAHVGGFAITTIISEVHIGGSFGPTLNLALYNRLRTYMTAVGVP